MSQSSGSKVQIPKDKNPWAGLLVVISQAGHPWKGYTGIVQDVLYGQATSSGMSIGIQLTRFNPTAPYEMVLILITLSMHSE
jgi:hypothetical protein